ncbi:MAG: threonylcarbamoyl-AMP synthase [Acholeplasmataceae bacterium]|nr:threonylcarbamoyl-AMP synthase [Acholeplasmataceae bacterium]
MMNKGDLIVIPTDTVYGLAAKLYDDEALLKIYEIKGREQSKKIPLLISHIDQLKDVCVTSDLSLKLMNTYWPGALTIVLNTTPIFKSKTGEETIAVRMPKHPTALKLIDTYGILRVTSLNKSGEEPLSNIKDINKIFGNFVNEIYPHGDIDKSHVSSTVVDLTTDEIKILRQGDIKLEDLKAL